MATARRFFGFSLIEVLLTIGIFSILFTLAIGAYKDFQNNQVLNQAKETLKTNLRFAQSQALGGVRDCGASNELLTGWFVSFSNTSYTLNVQCGATLGNNPRIINVDQGITFSTNMGGNSLLFHPINKEVALINGQAITPLSGDTTITLTKGSKSATVTIRKTGDIL